MVGRRLGKQLQMQNIPLVCYVDIDPKKIGRTRRGLPIIAPDELLDWWRLAKNPALLAAVGVRGARGLIRTQLNQMSLTEGQDWWALA